MLKQQSGSVLLVALGLTLVISIMVISAVQRTGLQNKMAANMKDKELSFQAAESALKHGEDFIAKATEEDLFGRFDNSKGLYTYKKDRDFKSDESWKSFTTREADKLHNVSSTPVYIVEELPEVREIEDSLELPRARNTYYYRITAKSNGGTGNAKTTLQIMYKK